MGFNVNGEVELFKVKLPDGDWIDISKYETEEDHRKILSLIGKYGSDITPTMGGVDLGETRQITLENRIKFWSFMDGEGNPVPVTPESISKLPRKINDFVMVAISKLEEEDFLASKKGKS